MIIEIPTSIKPKTSEWSTIFFKLWFILSSLSKEDKNVIAVPQMEPIVTSTTLQRQVSPTSNRSWSSTYLRRLLSIPCATTLKNRQASRRTEDNAIVVLAKVFFEVPHILYISSQHHQRVGHFDKIKWFDWLIEGIVRLVNQDIF